MSSALETLRRDFGGDIIEPGEAEYESARRTVLASGSPAHVLRPKNVGDVQAGVRFAARAGHLLSVRGGGHGYAGFGTNDGGLVIDLSRLANVEIIDKERHLVRIGGGATWGQVAAALAPHDLAISSGDTKSVGVGGLILTGGIGWKVRKYGLALDNVAAAEVVTANGQVVHASAQENPELFWAIRGGGGNFGIVTALSSWPIRRQTSSTARSPSRHRRRPPCCRAGRTTSAPPPKSSHPSSRLPIHSPADPKRRSGSTSPSTAMTRSSRPRQSTRSARLGTVTGDDIALKPYADTLADGTTPPPGIQLVLRSAFAGQESVPEVLQILAEVRTSERSPFIAVRSVGGAVSRVPGDATAYAHRQAELMVVTTTAGPKRAVEAARPALDVIWRNSHPTSTAPTRTSSLLPPSRMSPRSIQHRPISGSRRSSAGTTPATCSPATTTSGLSKFGAADRMRCPQDNWTRPI